MKLVKPSFEIKNHGYSLQDIYKHIEWVGRHCYKSHDKITETSAEEFVNRMIKSGHGAMLEHGTVYLTIPGEHEPDEWGRADVFINYKGSYRYNKYSKVMVEYWEQEPVGTQCEFCKKIPRSRLHITTNLRVLVENNWLDDLKYLCEPTEYHEKRITVKFITDQGILRELTRHRVFSFAVESTRYCNYSKDKFGNEVTFILPSWMDEIQLGTHDSYKIIDQISPFDLNTFNTDDREELIFLSSLAFSEIQYFNLLNKGWKPQQARNVLPLATKCEIIMTGFASDWKHFFDLRDAVSAHPQARELAEPLHKEFINRQYI